MNNLEIFEYEGVGYDRTVNFESWRVAIANYGEKFDRKIYNKLERHLLTDEVFVLLSGTASLIIGKEMTEYIMEPGKIYNVKKGSWHNVLINKGAKVLIVENHNTSLENTEYYFFKGEENE